MAAPIPFLDLPGQHAPLLDEIRDQVSRLMARGRFIGGEPVDQLEQDFAKFCGVSGCAGVANGTDALMLALRALDVGPGDVVLVPAHTFIATAEAVTMVGAIPRFVEIDESTYSITAKSLAAVDAERVAAVIAVHLYGQSADMDPISKLCEERGWKIVEDAAQAHGATYRGRPVGSLGDMAAFSFYPGKNLGAFGDGGAVVTNDLKRLTRVRCLADHGRASKQLHSEPGVNSRLDSIQAAVLSIKLGHLREWNGARRAVAAKYDERLGDLEGVVLPRVGQGREHVYHLYVIQVPERERLQQALKAAGIGSGIHYEVPLHLQPAYASLGYARGDFPVAERVTGRCLSLPMFPGLREEQIDRVAAKVREHVGAGG